MTAPAATPTASAFVSSPEAGAHFEGQGHMPAGTPGFWKVYGASVADVRPGDLLITKGETDFHYDLIADTFESEAAPLRRGLVNAEGDRFTLGALCPVIVLRWGTHATLGGES